MDQTVDTNPIGPTPPTLEPDAHGQAALLLSDSMLRTLIELGLITTAQAIAIVRTAYYVKLEVAQQSAESDGQMRASLDLLFCIAANLDKEAV